MKGWILCGDKVAYIIWLRFPSVCLAWVLSPVEDLMDAFMPRDVLVL